MSERHWIKNYFLKIFYKKNDKIINFIDNFLYFFMKVVLKFSYYSLLINVLRASVNVTHNMGELRSFRVSGLMIW